MWAIYDGNTIRRVSLAHFYWIIRLILVALHTIDPFIPLESQNVDRIAPLKGNLCIGHINDAAQIFHILSTYAFPHLSTIILSFSYKESLIVWSSAIMTS